MISLMELVENNILTIACSDVLLYELNNTPDPDRIAFGMKFLKLCKVFFSLTDEVVIEAKKFEKAGIKPIDALHLAIATINEIDYLCTCDDRFLKKADELKLLKPKIVLPTRLIGEILP